MNGYNFVMCTYISKVCASLYGCYVVAMMVCELLCVWYLWVVWCAGVYGCAVLMCLCLCVVSHYVCVLCHVLVVSVLVLELLSWSVICCCWWICPRCWFALVSMPGYLWCAYLIVGMWYR